MDAIDKVYFLHFWAYERQSDGPFDSVDVYLTHEEAELVLLKKVKENADKTDLEWDGEELSYSAGNWEYRYWIEEKPVSKA